ncbi:MAG: signal transduction histidine kinase [Saprospiraceae bacterium]|jgi:signal transduction histidine kinase
MTRNFILLSIAIFLLIIAYSYDKINTVSLSQYVDKIESKIQRHEAEILKLFENDDFIDKAINYDFLETELGDLEKLSNKDYSIFIYQNPDSLVFWTSNKILPFDAEVEFSDIPISRFSNIKNGGYAILNYPYIKDNIQYALVGLIPITHQYSIENEYLINGFSIIKDIPKEVRIQFEPNEYEVKNAEKETLFYLTSDDSFLDKRQQYSILTFYLLGLIVFFLFLNNVAIRIAQKGQSQLAVLFLLVIVFACRLGTIWLGFGAKFDDLYLFNTQYFSNLSIFSLGNLLINSIIGLWLMIFIYRELKLPQLIIDNKKQHPIYLSIAYLLIFSGVTLTIKTFQQLILYSSNSFDIDSLYSLNAFPLIGTLTLSLILFTLFLFIVKIKLLTQKFRIELRYRVAIELGIIIVTTILYFLNLINFSILFAGYFAAIVSFMTYFFVKQKAAGFLWLVGWICVFGIFSSVLLTEFNKHKELNNRIFYAENLALERDIYTEGIFDNVAATITQDPFIKKISNLFIPRNRIIEQINEGYLKEKFSTKYEYSVHLYSADSTGTKGENILYQYFADFIDEAEPTNNPNLYYWNNGIGQQRYIADIPILADNRKYYKIVILLEPKTIEKLSSYPELLLDKSFDLQKRFKEYNYAIYKNEQKIKDKGGEFTESLSFNIPKSNNQTIQKGNINYLLHKAQDNRIIIVGREVENAAAIFSLFSYMFCLSLTLFSIILVSNRLAENLPGGSFLDVRLPSSLRNKIQNNVLAIVVLAFIGIGVTTVFYFRSEAQDYHAGRLGRKARAVNETSKYEMDKTKDSFYLPDIIALSQIHSLDVNLYDFDGEIINSSQPEIITKNLLSRRMDPVAFHGIYNLKKELEYRKEQIGNLRYSAAYMPVKRGDKIVAFIGLPYYTEVENSRKDIGRFMGRLLNVYVVIFIIAGIVTFFLTGQITNPLDKLSKQMQNVKLGQHNEALQWGTQDEIGLLIEEYNKMLKELEKSANLLARSEREGAWREMAKQVAHEIKNPLTPMKLQIQFLQRAYKSRPEDIGPLLKRTAYTMIEQIDGLTRIASDFSNFAKMPTAYNEYLQLNTIVESVYQLFSKEETILLTIDLTKEDCTIFADKNQVIRVLNNIIKNAIQAITFAIAYEREGQVDIKLTRKGDVAIVSVRDNGSGIPEDKRKKVFVPNFTTKSSGTGLGLAMSKNIVEATGGKIYFKTDTDIGTVFFVEIPITEKEN